MLEVTVFTPTYNRAKEIKKLYESLVSQTDRSFQWLVVDDGSEDGTYDQIQEWMDESCIAIRYLFQKNQGKCAAYKNAVRHCDTPWFICVDSDDALSPEAVRIMRENIRMNASDSMVGFVYPQNMDQNNEIRWVPDDVDSVSIMDIKNLYGITETAILFRSECLKCIEFPVFENEKFLSEEVLYIELSKFGDFVPRNSAFYLSEYQDAGLTRNLFKHWVKNPKGTILLLKKRFEYSQKYGTFIRIRERIKCIMNLNALCMVCGLQIRANTPSFAYSMALLVPSMIWKKLRFQR